MLTLTLEFLVLGGVNWWLSRLLAAPVQTQATQGWVVQKTTLALRQGQRLTDAALSVDGRFLTLADAEGGLWLADLQKPTVPPRPLFTPTGGERLAISRWLPDRDTLLYLTEEEGSARTLLRFHTYDAQAGAAPRLQTASLVLPGGSANVTDLALSVTNNLIYVAVRRPATDEALLYRMDIMNRGVLLASDYGRYKLALTASGDVMVGRDRNGVCQLLHVGAQSLTHPANGGGFCLVGAAGRSFYVTTHQGSKTLLGLWNDGRFTATAEWAGALPPDSLWVTDTGQVLRLDGGRVEQAGSAGKAQTVAQNALLRPTPTGFLTLSPDGELSIVTAR